MKIKLDGLLENLLKKKFNYNIDLVLEGGCMNGAYEIGGLILLKELENNNKVCVNRLSGASVGSFISLLYLTNNLEYYTKCYKSWRESFNNTIKLENLKDLVMKVCQEMPDDIFKSLQKNKLFITYYDINTKKCILKKQYETRLELGESVLKSCHLPYLINGKVFYKTEEGEYLDGGLPYIFKIQENRKILYMKLTQAGKLQNIFNVSGEINIDGRILEGMLDMYNFFMTNKSTEMCSFVNNWGFISMIRYNAINYIYFFIVCFFIYMYQFICIISPKLETFPIYQRLKPIGNDFYREIVRYLVFN